MPENHAHPLVLSTANFAAVVLAAPPDQAVVVDFWAPWCAPCKALEPVLERVVASFGGHAILARVNIDAEADLAEEFGVQSIPAVKVFRGGAVVAQFVGALPEADVYRQLAAVIPSPLDDALVEADDLMLRGDYAGAEAKYRELLARDPSHMAARVRLGRILVDRGVRDEAEKLLVEIPHDADEYVLAQALLAEIHLSKNCEAAGGIDAARNRLASNPGDLEARFSLGCCLAVAKDYRAALDALLAVVAADRNFRDGAAKAAIVQVFAVIGQRSELADEYRQRLANLLY
jgi:putative thioredoxin